MQRSNRNAMSFRNPRLKGGGNMIDSKITGVIVAGLLAVLGTVGGSVLKWSGDINLAQKDLESKLILRALEADDEGQRIRSLKFLVETNLISDGPIRDGVKKITDSATIAAGAPNFRKVDSTSIQRRELTALARIEEKYPKLKGKTLALVGFRVRHGNIIDALAPIYAEVDAKLTLKDEYEGNWIGGGSTAGTELTKPGYVVTGIEKQRGDWFGGTEVVHIRIRWNRLTSKGIDTLDSTWSEKLGNGLYVKTLQEPELLQAIENDFISDFDAQTSYRTGGQLVLHDIQIN
jgi:hypothetical protein